MALPAAADSYYVEPPLFSTAPDPEKSGQTISRCGPVGMAIDLIQPAFTMRVRSIEEGSPVDDEFAPPAPRLNPPRYRRRIRCPRLRRKSRATRRLPHCNHRHPSPRA